MPPPSKTPEETLKALGRRAVAVVFGGPSPEHDVSILTGLQAARELGSRGRRTIAIYWTRSGEWRSVDPSLEASAFADGVPRGARSLQLIAGPGGGFVETGGITGRSKGLEIGCVLNCCHGGPGEDGTLQGTLDLAGLAYTGPTASGASLGMDKLAFAGVVSAAGLPCLPRVALTAGSEKVGFEGPYILKPRYGGSSIGIDVVEDMATALDRLAANTHLRRGAVVEPYRKDLFDLNVAVRTWPEMSTSAVERPLRTERSAEILGYADKYVGGEGMAGAPRELPARIAEELTGALISAAREVASLTSARGTARIDFLSDGESFYVNEVNTIPGSLGRYLWIDPPLAFGDLLDALLAEAMAMPAAQHSATGADGTVLRSAGSIASKLA